MSSNKKRKVNAYDEDCIAVEKWSFGVYLHEDCHRNFKPEIVPLLNFLNKIILYSNGEVDLTKVIQQLQQFVTITNISLEMDLRKSLQNVLTFTNNM